MGLRRDLAILGVMVLILVTSTVAWTAIDEQIPLTVEAIDYTITPVSVVAGADKTLPTNFVIMDSGQLLFYLKLNNPGSPQTIDIQVQPLNSSGDIPDGMSPQIQTGISVPSGDYVVPDAFTFLYAHVDRYVTDFLIVIDGPGYTYRWTVTGASSTTGYSVATLAVTGFSITSPLSASKIPQIKHLNPATWVPRGWQAPGVGLNAAPTPIKHVRVAFNPNWKSRFEIIAIVMTTDGTFTNFNLYAYVYDGADWQGPESIGTGPGNGSSIWKERPFDVAYEQSSSRAIVVWNNAKSPVDRDLAYKVWDGIAWSTVAYIDTVTSGSEDYRYIKLEADPSTGSNEVACIGQTRGTTPVVKCLIWDGSSWGTTSSPSRLTLADSAGTYRAVAGTDTFENIDIAYETGNPGYIVATAACVNTADSNRYRFVWSRWTGSSWSNRAAVAITPNSSVNKILYLVLKPCRVAGSTKMIILGMDTSGGVGRLYAKSYTGGIWDGTATPIDTGLETANTRCFDGDWQPDVERYLLVYSTTASRVTYRTCTFSGSTPTWTAATTLNLSTGTPNWIQVRTNPKNADPRILVGVVDGGNALWIFRWTGVGATGGTIDAPAIDLYGQFTTLSSILYEGFEIALSFP